MKIKTRFTLSTMLFYIALTCVVSYAILEDTVISIPEFTGMRRILLIVAGVCLFRKAKFVINTFRKKEYISIMVVLVLFLFSLVVSARMNMTTYADVKPVYATVNLCIFLIELFVIAVYAAEHKKVNQVFHFLFWYALIVVLVTDFIMFTGAMTFTDGLFETYLIGTKFSVSYIHIYLLAFFLMIQKSKLRFKTRYIMLVLCFSFIVVAVAQHVDCNTGILGCLLLVGIFLVFNVSPNRWLKRFASGQVFTAFSVGSCVTAFLFEAILANPFIEHIVVDILQRSTTMTGRTEIFGAFILKMAGHWLWGYGYGSAYRTSMTLFKYADAQNGLLQWILQIGIIPTCIMVILFVMIFMRLAKVDNKMPIMPVIALIYVFVILGTVEITMNMNFFLWMALIFMWIHRKERKIECLYEN